MENTPIAEDQIARWYVFSISFKKELEIRDELQAQGFEAYVPMHFTLHTIHGRKVRKQEPAVFGLVFVKGGRRQLLDFRETSRLKTYMFLKSHRMMDGILQYVYVRDNDMANFRKLNEVEGVKLTYYKPNELRIAKGEKVRIMDGPFEGITGVVQKLPRKKGQYLVVSLPDVAIAAVSIKPEYIKPITHKVAKSTDVEKDSKRLAQLAIGVIAGDDTLHKESAIDEINQLAESLQDCKTFLTNDKANYHFAFFAAALATRKATESHRLQLEKVMPRLKGNNLLLPTAHLLFYYENGDKNELKIADDITSKWDNTKYTDSQKRILTLRRALVHPSTDDANSK